MEDKNLILEQSQQEKEAEEERVQSCLEEIMELSNSSFLHHHVINLIWVYYFHTSCVALSCHTFH